MSESSESAEYRIVVNTDFTEPGFDVGAEKKISAINLTCKAFNIATGEQVATIVVRNSSANNFVGGGFRIEECYAKAGRELAKFFIKKAKL